MAAEPKILHLSPDDALVLAVKRVAKDRELVIVDTGEEVIEISLISAHPTGEDDQDDTEPTTGATSASNGDPLLNIFGVFSSGEPNDVASDKYRYLADAYLNERE